MINRIVFCLLILILTIPALAVIPPTDGDELYNNHPQLQQLTGATHFEDVPFDWSVVAEFDSRQWQMIRYERSGHIAQIVGAPLHLFEKQAQNAEISTTVKTLAGQLSAHFGLSGYDFQVVKINRFNGFITVLVQPEYDGRGLYGSFMAFGFTSDGDLVSVKGRGFGSNIQGAFSLEYDQAVEIARQHSGISNGESKVENIWLPVMTAEAVEIRAAYQVELIPPDPSLRPAIYIDAGSGEVLAAENRVVHDQISGQIQGEFLPLYPRGDRATAPFPHEIIRIDNSTRFTDANGEFDVEVNANNTPYDIYSELRGRWVDVNYDDGADATFRFQMQNAGEIEVLWGDRNARLDERGLYYHTDFIHTYWKELDENFDGMDYPVPATCMYGNNYDNAFWNGQGMFFGDGDQRDNFALITDIIYHEYGHGVTGNIYPWGQLPYTGESGALNEAWSDYFPCSISGDPLMGEGGFMGGAIRNLDNNFVHNPPNWNQVHRDSRIISAAMWHSREVLGLEITDPLFHYARYHYGNNFMTYFVDILITDDDDGDITNGSPNGYALYEQFGRHGIGPGVTPDFSTKKLLYDDDQSGADGNGNNLWEAGEIIRLEIELFRAGSLYPPAAENVQIELTCDHPSVELIRSMAGYGDMRVDDRQQGDQPFLFGIREDAELSFADFTMIITAEDFRQDTTFRIPIGRPPILLVRDGRHEWDYTSFFEESLDGMELVYDQLRLADPIFPVEQRLEMFNTVIWFTGDARDDILQRDDREALEDFLDGGGNLLLTGQSAGTANGSQDFFRDYLGAINTIDSVRHFDVLGVEDDPASNELWLLLTGSPGAMNQRRPGAVRAIEPAVEIFHWTERVEEPPAAGVRRIDPRSGARTIYLSFGLEAVSGRGPTDNMQTALGQMLQWLDVPVSVVDEAVQPTSFEILTPYPNPFNSAITLQFRISHREAVNFSVYDLSGRVMASGNMVAAVGLNEWSIDSAGWGSGVYFAVIQAQNRRQSFRLVHLK